MWECKICNVCFEEIPDNSELIREKQGISMYRIDGMIHIIRKKPTPKAKMTFQRKKKAKKHRRKNKTRRTS